MTRKKEPSSRRQKEEVSWYLSQGWKKTNEVLRLMEEASINHARIENFQSFAEVLKHVSRSMLMSLLPQDTMNWTFVQEDDGEIIAIRRK